MNQVTLVGRIGQTPELQTLAGGTELVNFSLVTNRKYKNAAGETVEANEWHNCVAWKNTARPIAQYVVKGQQLVVSGEIRYDKWEDKDGNARTAAKIHVNRFEFGAKPKGHEQAPAAAPPADAPAF